MSWNCNKIEKLIQFFKKFIFKDFTLENENIIDDRPYLWSVNSWKDEIYNNTRTQPWGSHIKLLKTGNTVQNICDHSFLKYTQDQM